MAILVGGFVYLIYALAFWISRGEPPSLIGTLQRLLDASYLPIDADPQRTR